MKQRKPCSAYIAVHIAIYCQISNSYAQHVYECIAELLFIWILIYLRACELACLKQCTHSFRAETRGVTSVVKSLRVHGAVTKILVRGQNWSDRTNFGSQKWSSLQNRYSIPLAAIDVRPHVL